MPKTRRQVNKIRAIGLPQYPHSFQVDPLGVQDKSQPDDRTIEKLDLELEEAI